MRRPLVITVIASCCIAATLARRAHADDDPDALPIVKFHVTARGQPTPALRYPLLPSFLDLKPGNAALNYAKVTVKFDGPKSEAGLELDNRIGGEWLETPVEKLPRDKVEADLKWYEYYLAEVERAARMQSCDWQLDLRSEKPWQVRLPEVQGMRQLARALVLRARLQIHDHKYDEALHTLQTGFAMARHVTEGETLVNALVGAAISGILLTEVETLMRTPDAPNLYWSLVALPRPLIDMRKALGAELHFVDFSFPGAQNLRQAEYTADQWRALVNKMDNFLIEVNGGGGDADGRKVLSTVLAMQSYPSARQSLIDSGISAEAVDKMHVAQVVAIHKLESFQKARDDMFKWLYLPVWQQRPGLTVAERALSGARQEAAGFPLTELLPAVSAATNAQVRLERRIASLAAVNALRIYAASHNGKLPATLAEITEAPVLADPSTGQPFGYSVHGNTATLTSPDMPNLPKSVAGLHYEITIAP